MMPVTIILQKYKYLAMNRKPNENFSSRKVEKKIPKQGKEPQNANP